MYMALAYLVHKRKRKRSRSRSSSRSCTGSSSRVSSSSSVEETSSPPLAKSIRFFCIIRRVDNPPLMPQSYLLDMQPLDLNLIRNVDPRSSFIYHCHGNPRNYNNNGIFRSISGRPLPIIHHDRPFYDVERNSWPVHVGPVVYLMYELIHSGIDNYKDYNDPGNYYTIFMTINLDNGRCEETIISPYFNRLLPMAFSLRGKVYFLGGLQRFREPEGAPYGRFFDPTSNTWNVLTQPPNAATLTRGGDQFVSSLGEKEGKIMVYEQSSPRGTIYIYDITTDEWVVHPCEALDVVRLPRSIVGAHILNEEDGNLYWLGDNGFIYAFDWKAMGLYSGSIAGMEHVPELKVVKEDSRGFVLRHLWSDFFCLFWSHISTSTTPEICSEFHYTFLRVIKDSSTKSLSVFVVGCFMDSVDGACYIHDMISV